MKTLTLFISLMAFWTINIFGQSDDVDQLLENQKTRSEIFNSILNNHELMTEFIRAMNNNDHAMMMMREDSYMMNNQTGSVNQRENGYNMPGMMGGNQQGMMGGNHQEMMGGNQQGMMQQMMGYLHENPEMIPQMMGNMLALCEKDTTQCTQIAKVMSEYPHMMMKGLQQMNRNESGELNTNMNMMSSSGELKDTQNHPVNK
jgi:hypothetical protein